MLGVGPVLGGREGAPPNLARRVFLRPLEGTKRSMRIVRLPPELRSAPEARRFVEDELGPAGAGEDTLLHAQLVATELVTNAARHAESPVELTIERGDGRVRIEARDDSATLPKPPAVDTPTRHRGLQLIEDLSQGWGVEPRADRGKVVWCELGSRGLARKARLADDLKPSSG